MRRLLIVSPRELQGETISFFPLLDKDVQDAIWPNSPTVTIEYNLEKCVRTATLFQQYNIASASMYYESAATREISKRHKMLFSNQQGPFIFAFKEEHNNFLEHAKEKRELCPDSEFYRREVVKQYSAELESYFGRAFARPGGETSVYIAQAMERDLSSDKKENPDSLAGILAAVPSPNDRAKYEEVLRNAVVKRGELQINRPYLERRLRGLPQPFITSVDRRLLYHYLSTTQKTTGIHRIDATSDAAPFQNVEGLNTQNFSLAMEFLDSLGISSTVMSMTDRELLELRKLPEVISLMRMYQHLVNEAATIEENKEKLYWEYRKEKRTITYPYFVELLKAAGSYFFVESVANSLPPLEKILAASALFGSETIVQYLSRNSITMERKPLLDFEKLVLEQYGRKLEDSAVSMLEVDDYSRIPISTPSRQAIEMYLYSRRFY